jgi:cysteinyl-tRNA synthetase
VWRQVLAADDESRQDFNDEPSPEVLALVEEREAARACRDWSTSDELRDRIAALGWQVRDTASGPELVPN